MPVRLCLEPRCPEAASYRGRCPTHARARDQATHPNKHIYNSKRWRMLRRAVLHDTPLCTVCGHVATDVDHVVAIEAGGDPWARANLQALCRRHHSEKTRREQRARSTPGPSSEPS